MQCVLTFLFVLVLSYFTEGTNCITRMMKVLLSCRLPLQNPPFLLILSRINMFSINPGFIEKKDKDTGHLAEQDSSRCSGSETFLKILLSSLSQGV